MNDLSRMIELINQLNYYRDMYYNHDKSIITDREYDYLYDQLVECERDLGVIYPNSPTQTVGYKVVSKLNKVTHNHELLSLDKTTDIDEFESFFGDKPYIVMPKLDGLTCSIIYRDGKIFRAESRGDGVVGEDITHNAYVFANLPQQIPFKKELIVDGECVIIDEDFNNINAIQRKNGEKEYKNPRNLVSGTVRLFDNELVAERNVRFIAWKLYSAEGIKFEKHSEAIKYLQTLGFGTVAPELVQNGKAIHYGYTCKELIETMRDIYTNLGVPIDGMVGMFDDIEYGLSLGRTTHHPKHSLAFKFYPESNETILRDIEWNTSRTGLINPVAVFDPVEIDGTTVSRATLNNVSIIKELQLGIGDKINVIKANEIIPQIKENLTRSNTYHIPVLCPSCHKQACIKNANGREMLYCDNKHCPSKIHDRIANFASREGMNIVGISEERLKALMEMGYIKRFRDLYHLKDHRDQIIGKPGFGESSIDNILQAIEESRNCKLANVIVAIGIPNIGKTTAKTIAEKCEAVYKEDKESYVNLLDCFTFLCEWREKWSDLPAIGFTTQHAINDYVNEYSAEIQSLVRELNIIPDDQDSGNKDLANKAFCITGKLEHFNSRKDLVADIESRGGIVTSSVTSKTNYLITNDKTWGSSKNKAAEKYGTKIISELDYLSGDL